MQILAKRFGAGLSDDKPIFSRETLDYALKLEERCNALYGLRAHRTQVVFDQFIKLSACVRETSCADAALQLQDLVVHPVRVGYQRTRPAFGEFKRIFGPSAQTEFVHHCG